MIDSNASDGCASPIDSFRFGECRRARYRMALQYLSLLFECDQGNRTRVIAGEFDVESGCVPGSSRRVGKPRPTGWGISENHAHFTSVTAEVKSQYEVFEALVESQPTFAVGHNLSVFCLPSAVAAR